MNAFLSAVTDVSGSLATVLDVASVSWLVVAVALMVLGEFESSRARKARWALVPVALILGAAFAVKLLALFVPMLGLGSA
ncbi:MAG: hypothetical protein KF813_08195 [Trueperaceae bacterium]|nr:hypothetical protein [Trueperaceae bacterium]